MTKTMKKNFINAIRMADELYETSQDDNLTEETQDAAYIEFYDYLYKIADMLNEYAGIDRKTGLRMAAHKRNEILTLVKRTA